MCEVIVEGADRTRSYFVGDLSAISVRVDRSEKGDAIAIQAQVQDDGSRESGVYL